MPPQASITATAELPTSSLAATNQHSRDISGATIAICAVGGTLVLVGVGLALWLLRRKRNNDTIPVMTQQAHPRHASLATSIATSAQATPNTNEKAFLNQQRHDESDGNTLSATSFSPTMSEVSQVPRPLEVFRNFSRKGRPRNHGHCRGQSQAKSVGGIYELPASPRRIFIPTSRGNECRHTWVAGEVPQDVRNKSLPEIPGETRQWI